MALKTWKEEDLIRLLPECKTKSELITRLGLKVRPGNYRTIDSYIEKLNLDCSHMLGKAHGTSVSPKTQSLKDILIKGSTYKNNTSLKRRLIKEGKLENKCLECNQRPDWKGKKLVMVLDHINGRHTDNRIENLRFLCPNCNSQQDTFCGRNREYDK